jgi:Putative Actinobacterial Holin-X, holin superfamily III
MAYESDASMATLVKGVVEDVRELFREEMALARAELRHEMSKAMAALKGFGGAAVLLWFGSMFILTAIALGVADLLNWPAWAGFASLGVLLAIIGGVVALGARRIINDVQPMPRTVETVKETFQ